MRDKTIFINFTTENELRNIIKNLEIKAGGVDGINTKVLKVIVNFIARPLTCIFNQCIHLDFQANALKKTEIVPKYKTKEKYKVKNYRPISLTSNIAKIFEKIIHCRI